MLSVDSCLIDIFRQKTNLISRGIKPFHERESSQIALNPPTAMRKHCLRCFFLFRNNMGKEIDSLFSHYHVSHGRASEQASVHIPARHCPEVSLSSMTMMTTINGIDGGMLRGHGKVGLCSLPCLEHEGGGL